MLTYADKPKSHVEPGHTWSTTILKSAALSIALKSSIVFVFLTTPGAGNVNAGVLSSPGQQQELLVN